MTRSEIKRLDTLWSIKIKERDRFRCKSCLKHGRQSGGLAWVEASHIVGRSYRTLRWSLKNGITLCTECHKDYDQHRPQTDKTVGHEYVANTIIGEELREKLHRTAQIIARNQNYEEIKSKLERA